MPRHDPVHRFTVGDHDPRLVVISLFVFSIMHLLPGDPATLILQGQAASTPEQINALREELGLNKPVYVRYALS